jgi:hypothetical protein
MSSSLGFGSVNRISTANRSIEGYDGYDDEIYASVTRSEEALKFLDTFELMENKRTADKVRMLRKINANYNRSTIINPVAANSIESYIQSQEEEAVASNATGAAADKPNTEAAKKKQGFFKKLIEAIKNFFKRIGDFFKKVFQKIKDFFMGKKLKNAVMKTPEELRAQDAELQKKFMNKDVNNKNYEVSVQGSQHVYYIDYKKAKLSNIEEDFKIVDDLCQKTSSVFNKTNLGIWLNNRSTTLNNGVTLLINDKKINKLLEEDDDTFAKEALGIKLLRVEEFIRCNNTVEDIRKFFNGYTRLEQKYNAIEKKVNSTIKYVEDLIPTTNVNDKREKLIREAIKQLQNAGKVLQRDIKLCATLCKIANEIIKPQKGYTPPQPKERVDLN